MRSVDDGIPAHARNHVLSDLGWSVNRTEGGMLGTAEIVPEMCVPGTAHLRTSILAIWTDVVSGLLVVDAIRPRVPVTLELDVHAYRPLPGSGRILGHGVLVKSGRSVSVAQVDFADADGTPLAFGAASFMAAPDASMRIDFETSADRVMEGGGRLATAFAEHAGCERTAPGVAVLSRTVGVRNASNTINGGLIALTAEEAALSLEPDTTLASLGLRYLQPARVGPVTGRAVVYDGLGQIEVRDTGGDDRLCVMATSRTFWS